MKRVYATFVTLLVVLALTVKATEQGKNDYNCEQGKGFMMPCLGYLIGLEESPSSECCKGVGEVKASAPTRDDRHAACQCLQNAAKLIPAFKEDKATALPKLCAVSLDFPFSLHVDCNKIP